MKISIRKNEISGSQIEEKQEITSVIENPKKTRRIFQAELQELGQNRGQDYKFPDLQFRILQISFKLLVMPPFPLINQKNEILGRQDKGIRRY
ncbi:unnamed protein product [Paramecium octaurelia]|uniref:Uncharacterized protein n=1 Tax=Paramecium octaurelia TaxID=43137 RepID=A0A8S1YI82_PAROT|nr:unnamed protein product [Paramecium octaurelia]